MPDDVADEAMRFRGQVCAALALTRRERPRITRVRHNARQEMRAAFRRDGRRATLAVLTHCVGGDPSVEAGQLAWPGLLERFSRPTMLMAFGGHDERGIVAWVSEPRVTEAGVAELVRQAEPAFVELTDDWLADAVGRVAAWRDAGGTPRRQPEAVPPPRA